jgi:hypothetical protein
MVLTRISIAFLLLTAVCGAQIVNPPSNPVKSVSVSYAAKPGDSIILVWDGYNYWALLYKQ